MYTSSLKTRLFIRDNRNHLRRVCGAGGEVEVDVVAAATALHIQVPKSSKPAQVPFPLLHDMFIMSRILSVCFLSKAKSGVVQLSIRSVAVLYRICQIGLWKNSGTYKYKIWSCYEVSIYVYFMFFQGNLTFLTMCADWLWLKGGLPYPRKDFKIIDRLARNYRALFTSSLHKESWCQMGDVMWNLLC